MSRSSLTIFVLPFEKEDSVDTSDCAEPTNRNELKFKLPLVGYSGASQVEVTSARLAGSEVSIGKSGVALGNLLPGKVCNLSVVLMNKGNRAAYVRANLTNVDGKALERGCVAKLTPSKMVIPPGRTRWIQISLQFSKAHIDQIVESGSDVDKLMAIVCLQVGDEVSRTQLREAQSEGSFRVRPWPQFADYFDGEEIVRAESSARLGWGCSDSARQAIFDAAATRLRLGIMGGANPNEVSATRFAKANKITKAGGGRRITHHRGKTKASPKQLTKFEISPARSEGTIVLDESIVMNEPFHESLTAVHGLPSYDDDSVLDRIKVESMNVHAGQSALSVSTSTVQLKYGDSGEVILSNNTECRIRFSIDHAMAHLLSIEPASGIVGPHDQLEIVLSPLDPHRPRRSSTAKHGWRGQFHIKYTAEFNAAIEPGRLAMTVTVAATAGRRGSNGSSASLGSAPLVLLSKECIGFAPGLVVGQKAREPLKIFNQTFESLLWTISPDGPAINKDYTTGDRHVLANSPFRFSRMTGSVLGHSPTSLSAEFCPQKRGLCSQIWTIRFQDPADTSRETIRMSIELRGMASVSQPDGSLPELLGNDYVHPVHTRQTIGGVVVESDGVVFKPTEVRHSRTKKIKVCNKSSRDVDIHFGVKGNAFSIRHSSVSLRPYSFVRFPVTFSPPVSGKHSGMLVTRSPSLPTDISTTLQGSTRQ